MTRCRCAASARKNGASPGVAEGPATFSASPDLTALASNHKTLAYPNKRKTRHPAKLGELCSI